MEKLIELLNEYEKKRIDKINSEGKYLPIKLQFRPYTEEVLINKGYKGVILEVISKQYGFIKWLVDNDKIDSGGKITEDLTYEHFQIPRKYFRGGKYARLSEEMNDIFYHRILACLSIQDNPIEFLVSILK